MKKGLLFAGGFLTGVVATILVAFLTNTVNQPDDGLVGLSLLSEEGECLATNGEIRIFQVLKPNMALAFAGEYPDEITILLIDNEGNSFYDDQRLKILANECLRHIGTYQYTTNSKIQKTVPAVIIE